jgi:glycosyltransferase involved in cell wall biosynthesis
MKKKILFVTEDAGASGVWIVSYTLAKAMREFGMEVDFLFINTGELVNYTQVDGKLLNDSAIKSSVKSTFNMTFKLIIKKIFGRLMPIKIKSYFADLSIIKKYDKVFAIDLASIIMLGKSNDPHVRYVIHNQKSYQLKDAGGMGFIIDLFIFKKSLAGKNVICVSRSIMQDLLTKVGVEPNAISVVYNVPDDGIEYLRYMEKSQSDFFIAVGRLSRQKRFDRLINAYSIYSRHLISIGLKPMPLKIFGTGPELSSLSRQINTGGLSEYVFLLGHSEKVVEEIKNAAALLISSDYEGWPTVAVEAYLVGVEILSVPIMPMIEFQNLIGGTYLAIDSSAESLAELMLNYASNSLSRCIPIDYKDSGIFDKQTIVKKMLDL